MDIQRNRGSTGVQHRTRMLVMGVTALLLVAGLSWTLAGSPALAQSVGRGSAASSAAEAGVILSQIRSPNRDAHITQKTPITIEGIAWPEDSDPPYVTGDAFLEVERVTQRAYLFTWNAVPVASQYLVEEASDAKFTDADVVCFGATTECAHTGSDGTHYYRVKAVAASVEDSRWSNVVSVTVPWPAPAAGALGSPAAGSASLVGGPPVVEVRIDDGPWQEATVSETAWGGEWSYEWAVPEVRETQVTIASRAAREGGDFGPVDTITITLDTELYVAYLPLIVRRWPPVPYAPDLAAIDNPDQRVSYTLNWSYSGAPGVPQPTSYTIEEATDPAFTAPTRYTTSATQFAIADPGMEKEGGIYYYRVRGHNQHGAGPWSGVQSTTVRVVPHAPALHPIENPEGDDSYTVAWSYEYPYPPVDTFILQESTDAAFSDPVNISIDGEVNSYDFADKGSRTYYYRVKGRNAYGDGPWSEVRSVVSVSGDFYDDFTDPASGWLTHQARWGLVGCDIGGLQQNPDYKYSLFYEGGRYKVNIPLDCRAGGRHGDTRHIYPVVFPPETVRPTSKTCMEVRGSFERYVTYWSFFGLVFAASEDKSTVYSLEVNDLGDWAVLRRTGYDFPGPNHPWENEVRHLLVGYTGGRRWPARPAFEANTLRAEVEGNQVKLFINGHMIYQFSHPEIGSLNRVGVIGGNWEITPTQLGFDYFYIDEGCDSF